MAGDGAAGLLECRGATGCFLGTVRASALGSSSTFVMGRDEGWCCLGLIGGCGAGVGFDEGGRHGLAVGDLVNWAEGVGFVFILEMPFGIKPARF